MHNVVKLFIAKRVILYENKLTVVFYKSVVI
jgi:hypothetical protein